MTISPPGNWKRSHKANREFPLFMGRRLSFNQLFEENFGMAPKEYRSRIRRELANVGLIPDSANVRTLLDPEEPWLQSKLEEYLAI